MKIGIITHHYINTFGAFLQTYALQQAVASLMPQAQVEVVDYINHEHSWYTTKGWLRYQPEQDNFTRWREKARMPMLFAHARKSALRLSPKASSIQAVNELGYDAIIIGSDEVWNYADEKSVDAIKLGEGLTCPNLIAYAPSVGHAAFVRQAPDYLCEGIHRFRHLSARDDPTARLIHGLGHEACRVLDPTFLVPIPVEKPPMELRKPYILFYYCEQMPDDQMEALLRFAKDNGYALYGAGESGAHFTADTISLTPFQWVGMFTEASYVVTGTFHGAVFAVLNHKPFLCNMTRPSRVAKVTSLLEELDLSERRLAPDGDVEAVLTRPLNVPALEKRIEALKEQSWTYLRSSLAD